MIDRDDLPSVSAVLLAEQDLAEAIRRLDHALRERRYKRWDQPLPRGYPAAPLEWIGFLVAPLPAARAVAFVPHDPGAVFDLATWLSAAWPDELLVAWRRFRGGEPVAKFLVGGAPRWKDGDDPDHEVAWHVPRLPPAELRVPPRKHLPDSAVAVEELLEGVVEAFPRDLRPPAGCALVSYLERRSPLA
ncbi:MAG: hypothetical protein EP329_06405 [Deltaproteobacteria bacterium]|nr:MAG: hypothetical protein EP329_06405 [Deltaproteobacteria bacterium]